MSSHNIRYRLDDDGTHLALIPLGREGEKGVAILSTQDLDLLDTLGLSRSWNRLPRGGYVTASNPFARGSHVFPARVLVDAGPGESVFFIDGDPTNLRRANLILKQGWATRRDRDYLKPDRQRRQKANQA